MELITSIPSRMASTLAAVTDRLLEQLVQKTFEIVRPIHQVLGFEKSSASLDGVKGPEDRSQRLVVVGFLFQAQRIFLRYFRCVRAVTAKSRLWGF
jgi:hypothetical protein